VSTLNVNRIVDSSGGVLAPISSVHRNRIINGGMTISQRNGTSSVTPDNAYTLDRWSVGNTQTSKFTVQQDAGAVTPPTGFSDYLGVTSSSAYSVLTGDTFLLNQPIEGFNFADMGWGTASAATVTLSFWVRSSLTGTFGGGLTNSAANRSYPFSYTISAANTWEQKSVTIAGDTTGTWVGATNGIGVYVRFGLGSGATFSGTAGAWAAGNFVQPTGSVSVVGTNGATWYVTGVQLERGTQATGFEYRQYQQELALCQRYLPSTGSTIGIYSGVCYGTTAALISINFPVTTRVPPTGITLTGSYTLVTSAGGATAVGSTAFNRASTNSALLNATGSSGLVAGNATLMLNDSATILFTGCEL
jgi:hypothetical protein